MHRVAWLQSCCCAFIYNATFFIIFVAYVLTLSHHLEEDDVEMIFNIQKENKHSILFTWLNDGYSLWNTEAAVQLQTDMATKDKIH